MAKEILSGIYKIENLVNGKCYIGSAVNFERRKSNHIGALKRKRHHSPILQNAWDKYGEQAFIFCLVERVEDVSRLIAREQDWIDSHKPKYNACPIAGSCLGAKRSPEVRARMKEMAAKRGTSDQARAAISAGLVGKKFSMERRANMAASRIGKKASAETRARMSESAKKHASTSESKEKVSLFHKGRKRSESSKVKMSEAQKGRTHSVESRMKISKAKTGVVISPETRLKMSAALLGKSKPPRTDAHILNWKQARRRNIEAKKKDQYAIGTA